MLTKLVPFLPYISGVVTLYPPLILSQGCIQKSSTPQRSPWCYARWKRSSREGCHDVWYYFLQRDSLNSRSTGCHTFSQMRSENALTVRLSTGSINNQYEFIFLSVTMPLYFLRFC